MLLFKGKMFQDVETPNVSGDFTTLRCEVITEPIHVGDTISSLSLTVKHPLLEVI